MQVRRRTWCLLLCAALLICSGAVAETGRTENPFFENGRTENLVGVSTWENIMTLGGRVVFLWIIILWVKYHDFEFSVGFEINKATTDVSVSMRMSCPIERIKEPMINCKCIICGNSHWPQMRVNSTTTYLNQFYVYGHGASILSGITTIFYTPNVMFCSCCKFTLYYIIEMFLSCSYTSEHI